jgi:hypothetical protein
MSDNLQDVTIGNQQETDIAWLAGIIDGEGSFTVTKNKYAPDKPPSVKAALTIPNTDERIILKSVQILERFEVSFYISDHAAKNTRKRYWVVAVSKLSDLMRLTERLIPHLSGKKEQALLLHRYTSLRQTGPWIDKGINPVTRKHQMGRRPLACEEWDLVNKIYQENGKGSSTTTREAAEQLSKYVQ